MIMAPGKEPVFIDPIVFNARPQTDYIVYKKDDFITDKNFRCFFDNPSTKITESSIFEAKQIQSCELRHYRLAVAATGEYTIFQGGTVALALAAQVTTINRVNFVYERDLSITLSMISNNDTLIYTNPQTDPYTNGQADQMLDENQANVNTVIGAANYDIGHVFGTNSGGVAYLNCVCQNNKAQGVTGSEAPVGDPFDIDYVAHEMGHQFGANHSFNNSCGGNRNSSTAYETGSGSTIMGYAGVCSPNVQAHSDPYFHAISLQEIGTAISSPNHTCPVKTPLNNVPPIVDNVQTNYTIPAGTPFMVTASASDVDGDTVTYTFEQMNREITTQPPLATATKGPNFRSYGPSTDNFRTIPSVHNMLTNQLTWEKLANTKRTYKFRVTVRDNAFGGGCTNYKDLTVKSDTVAGPFVVLYPNTSSVIWYGTSTETVTWDVANTDVAPISCSTVNILLSTDGGETFTTMVQNTPNDGSEAITVPNVTTSQAVIKVESAAGTFFDVSDRLFKIKESGVGVNAISSVNFKIFPNPATQVVQLNMDNSEKIHGFQIFDLSGKMIKSSGENFKNNDVINISDLRNGVYLFETLLNDQKVIVKLMKE